MQLQPASKTVSAFTSVTLIENKRKWECHCRSHALPGSTALCQGVKRRGQKGRQHAYEEVRLLRAPCPRLIACGNLPCQWNCIFSDETAHIDLSQADPSAHAWILSAIHTTNNLWHTKGGLNADCNNRHFFFTKVCDVTKRRRYRFFISPSSKCLFLYLTLMWQTVCFVISAQDIWYKLGGVRLAGRMGEQEEDVKGREMSIHEECLSEQVVYTWQTLMIIIIIIITICKGQAVRVSVCCDWAVLQRGLIYFSKK